MSLLATCSVCDALLPGYNGTTRCPRCDQPCPTCQGVIGFCSHELPELKSGELGLTDSLRNPLPHPGTRKAA